MNATDTASLLFELGTEELPAGPLKAMALALRDGICSGLKDRGLSLEKAECFATPRRLAVLVTGVTRVAPDINEQVLGPPVQAAKDADGHWTGAAQGFARKHGVEPDALQAIDSDKGPRLGLNRTVPGARIDDCAEHIISAAVASIPVAKRMRWGRGRSEFLRPVQWLVALLDDKVIPLELFELTADRYSRGHRFHAPGDVALATATDYRQAMTDAWVMADFEQRRERIEQQVEAIAAQEGAIAVTGDDLLDEVTGLVEWPVALKGSFDSAFLRVPAEALISSMREHQKYFHMLNHEGQLLPLFITVSNIESRNPTVVVEGNEKVIRPRLSDAAFFFETDKQTPLGDRLGRLDSVVFQHKLGSLADKTARVQTLAAWFAEALGADVGITNRAAQLAKCDLVSDMVLEFPELQGIAGAHYARHDGEDERVVHAIEEHYWPKFAGDALPHSRESASVALADRFDTMVGIFGIGEVPTGSKDPFALRRASVGIIRILIELGAPFELPVIAEQAAAAFPAGVLSSDVSKQVSDYIIERLRAWYEDQGIGVGVLRAVTATGLTNPAAIDQRVRALNAFAQTDAAAALGAANKRVANILAKSEEALSGSVANDHLVEPEEQALFAALEATAGALAPLISEAKYSEALTVLATLREPVDAFFDKVMVNSENADQRRNRLLLLQQLRNQFVSVADIAQL